MKRDRMIRYRHEGTAIFQFGGAGFAGPALAMALHTTTAENIVDQANTAIELADEVAELKEEANRAVVAESQALQAHRRLNEVRNMLDVSSRNLTSVTHQRNEARQEAGNLRGKNHALGKEKQSLTKEVHKLRDEIAKLKATVKAQKDLVTVSMTSLSKAPDLFTLPRTYQEPPYPGRTSRTVEDHLKDLNRRQAKTISEYQSAIKGVLAQVIGAADVVGVDPGEVR